MKKSVRILLVIVLCLVLVALSIHSRFSFNSYRYDNASRYTAGGCEISRQVETVDINWVSGRVTIERHDGDDVVLAETSSRRLDKAQELHWWLDGDTLYVKYVRSGKNYSPRLEKELTLYLPAAMPLDQVLISTVSADIEADLPPAKDVSVNSVSGSAEITFQQTETMHCDTVSGDLLLRFATDPHSVSAESVSADMTVLLPADAGFTADIHSVSGKISGNLPPIAAHAKSCTHGDGSCRISLDSVSGDLILDAFIR